MPTLLIYLFKVNIALILFCAGYYFIFRKLTFYTLNRVYLVTALLFSSIYPLIDFGNLLPRHEAIKPLQVTDAQLIYSISNYGKAAASSGIETLWRYLLIIFWLGVTIMAIRLVLQFASLFNIYKRSVPQNIYNHQVRVIENEASAFSFWRSIYINPAKYSENEIESVVAHEDVHVKQWHTIDILLAEVSLVIHWFNPGIWLIKKAISENLEFITDRKILKQGVDAKSYQYSLLYASFNTSPNAVVNHFNISTIKKRIMMMNAKNSSVFSLTKYGLMMPAITALLLVFGTSKAELIKKSINRANEITNSAMTAAKDVILNGSNDNEIKLNTNDTPNEIRAAGIPLKTIAGVIPATQTVMSMTDTPKIKAIPKKIMISVSGVDSAYYLLNGKPITVHQAQNVNADEIANVSVFKGATATSLFGDVASKGAVLIITKGQENSADVQRIMQIAPIVISGEKTNPSNSYNNAGSVSINKKNDSTTTTNVIASPHPVIAVGSKIKDREVIVRGFASPQKKITVGPHGSLRETVVQGYANDSKNGIPASTKFIINNKEATQVEFDLIDPKNIESINVIKNAKTKEGIINVTTKDAVKPASKN